MNTYLNTLLNTLLNTFQQYPGHFSDKEQKLLEKELQQIDLSLLDAQRALLKERKDLEKKDLELKPFKDFLRLEELKEEKKRGQELCKRGKIAALIVAGGQGSRLGFEGPKGKFPVSVHQKTLFQLFAEKVLAASRLYQEDLCMALMTSAANHQETKAYFQEKQFFGLQPWQVDFFQQEHWPLLNEEGQLFLDEKKRLAKGPNGNGYALHKLYTTGIWQKWWERGVRYLHFLTIDNPLADPFDPTLLGFHEKEALDITIKACERVDAQENLGVLLQKNNKPCVVEYSEIPLQEREARENAQSLKHPCANISLFCFSMDFVQKIAEEPMPLHLAHKLVSSAKGKCYAWKFETFIFDLLEKSQKIKALIYPRKHCFAPLKQQEGPHGIKALQKALLERDIEIFEKISGKKMESSVLFELAQDFHYPSKHLKERWQGQSLPKNSYISGLEK